MCIYIHTYVIHVCVCKYMKLYIKYKTHFEVTFLKRFILKDISEIYSKAIMGTPLRMFLLFLLYCEKHACV